MKQGLCSEVWRQAWASTDQSQFHVTFRSYKDPVKAKEMLKWSALVNLHRSTHHVLSPTPDTTVCRYGRTSWDLWTTLSTHERWCQHRSEGRVSQQHPACSHVQQRTFKQIIKTRNLELYPYLALALPPWTGYFPFSRPAKHQKSNLVMRSVSGNFMKERLNLQYRDSINQNPTSWNYSKVDPEGTWVWFCQVVERFLSHFLPVEVSHC